MQILQANRGSRNKQHLPHIREEVGQGVGPGPGWVYDIQKMALHYELKMFLCTLMPLYHCHKPVYVVKQACGNDKGL